MDSDTLAERALTIAGMEAVLEPGREPPKAQLGQQAAAAQIVATVALVRAVNELREVIAAQGRR